MALRSTPAPQDMTHRSAVPGQPYDQLKQKAASLAASKARQALIDSHQGSKPYTPGDKIYDDGKP